MSRLYKKFKDEIMPAQRERHNERCPASLPVLKKIVVSMGLGDALKDKNALAEHTEELAMLSSQKPVVTKSKKAISNFKLREDQPVGLMVTLRGKRMYDFFDRFCNIVAPRIRDFRGLSPRAFDGRGNYSIGIREQIIFPEIDYDSVDRVRGLDVTITTTARTDEEALALLRGLGLPFADRRDQ